MSEKPILFNTEMVKAILEGRKTQTRRVVKRNVAPVLYDDGIPTPDRIRMNAAGTMSFDWSGRVIGWFDLKMPCKPGDVLYVRETWAKRWALNIDTREFEFDRYIYRADCDADPTSVKWYSSIHMPRAAARLFLRITGVRIGRLQDMTEEDAICEGYDGMPWCYHHIFENYPDSPIPCDASSGYDCPPDRPCDKSIPELFGETIWNSTIKKSDLPYYGWGANPWVWVIEFEKVSK